MMALRRSFDLRSLALLRILLGLYIVWDVWSRLKYPQWSLHWYTGNGFLEPGDSPHQSFLHRMWFYRGDEVFTILVFSSTVSLACMFSLGLYCHWLLKLALWLSVVSMQSKNMHVHDGSDTFLRHILLWCISIPVASVWSLDARRTDALQASEPRPRRDYQISTLPCWGLALQIVLMYLGTVFHRTLDIFSIAELDQCSWLPPSLTAIYYCLSGSFAVRDNWATTLVRNMLHVSQGITLVAMLTETLAPLACFFLSSTYIPPLLLFQMHLGMLVTTNLPNWQFMGMLATVVWIPTDVWDAVQRRFGTRNEPEKRSRTGNPSSSWPAANNKLSRGITYFLLTYMVYNWCGERGWVPKHDHGDIGEFLRFSQYWVMYSVPPTHDVNTIVVAKRQDGSYEDVWKVIRGEHAITMDQAAVEPYRQHVSQNMTHLYPSPRWERALSQWGSRRDTKRARPLLSVLCQQGGRHWQQVELIWQHLRVMPPESGDRFRRLPSDTVVTLPCEPRRTGSTGSQGGVSYDLFVHRIGGQRRTSSTNHLELHARSKNPYSATAL